MAAPRVVLSVVVALLLPLFFSSSSCVAVGAAAAAAAPINCSVAPDERMDCGYDGIDEAKCLARGCCWRPYGPHSAVPWCFFPAGAPATNCTLWPAHPSPSPPFAPDEMRQMGAFFLRNVDIQSLGGVAASPDNSTPGGSYFFHWERDGALCMRQVLAGAVPGADSDDDIARLMKSYTDWVVRVQALSDPNGIDVRTEPKYTLPHGAVYTGGWCRPQSDGPALRSGTLLRFANWLLAHGGAAYVKARLWTGDTAVLRGGAVRADLDWVVGGWGNESCDLWEEFRSTDFFWNRVHFRDALLRGATFAARMGDSDSAARYAAAGAAVNATLLAHYNGAFIFEAMGRERDAAVIAALNHAADTDALFDPAGPMVAKTVDTLNALFCAAFPINRADAQANVPGVLYGRYAGDTYAGGNPWVLLSAALAELFYRAAAAARAHPAQMPLPPDLRAAWGFLLPATAGEDGGKAAGFAVLADRFAAAGDAVLLRIRHHVSADGFHLAEQIDKNTGRQISATDLSWSYGAVFSAMVHRPAALGGR